MREGLRGSVQTETPDPEAAVEPEDDLPVGLWAKVKHLVVHRILRVDDTPHRIALGVFLGFLVGATPTIGFQMIIYVAVAAVVGANKISGILPVWLSNPITAVPLYYSNWKIGQFLMTGSLAQSPQTKAALERMTNGFAAKASFFERLTNPEIWGAALDTFVAMGLELWVGSIAVGLVFGAPAYWLVYRGVIAYRQRRAEQSD